MYCNGTEEVLQQVWYCRTARSLHLGPGAPIIPREVRPPPAPLPCRSWQAEGSHRFRGGPKGEQTTPFPLPPHAPSAAPAAAGPARPPCCSEHRGAAGSYLHHREGQQRQQQLQGGHHGAVPAGEDARPHGEHRLTEDVAPRVATPCYPHRHVGHGCGAEGGTGGWVGGRAGGWAGRRVTGGLEGECVCVRACKFVWWPGG